MGDLDEICFFYSDNEQLVEELNKLLIQKKISKTEVATRLGINPQGLNSLLNKKNFSFNDLKRILDVIDIEMKVNFVQKRKGNNTMECVKEVKEVIAKRKSGESCEDFEIKNNEQFSLVAGALMKQILLAQRKGYVKAYLFNQYSTGRFKVQKMKEVIAHEMAKTHIPIHVENGKNTTFGLFISRAMMYDNETNEVVDPQTFIIGTLEFGNKV